MPPAAAVQPLPDDTARPPGAALEPGRVMRALIVALASALACTAALLALVLLVVGRADWWRGFAAAAVLSVVSAVLSVVPLRVGLSFGMLGALAGHFAAMVLRLIVLVAGALLLVKVADYPPAPTLTLSVPFCFALLAAEAVTLARMFWHAGGIAAR